jgi:CrcB protein
VTPILFLAAAGAAAVGRFLVGVALHTWLALLVVNTLGSGLLGFVVASDASPAIITVVGTGFCGALTTYSSFALEARSFGLCWGTAYALLTLICACAAAALGHALA